MLTLAEAHRALVGAAVSGRLRPSQHQQAVQAIATFARKCDLVAMTEDVLMRAGRPFPLEPIRTLDAIHLATAILAGPVEAFVAYDDRLVDAARSTGMTVVQPGREPGQ